MLDFQVVSDFTNFAVQNFNKAFVYITDLTSTSKFLNYTRVWIYTRVPSDVSPTSSDELPVFSFPLSSPSFTSVFFLFRTSSGQHRWAPQSFSLPHTSTQSSSVWYSGGSSMNSGWIVVEWIPSLWKKAFTLFAIGMYSAIERHVIWAEAETLAKVSKIFVQFEWSNLKVHIQPLAILHICDIQYIKTKLIHAIYFIKKTVFLRMFSSKLHLHGYWSTETRKYFFTLRIPASLQKIMCKFTHKMCCCECKCYTPFCVKFTHFLQCLKMLTNDFISG